MDESLESSWHSVYFQVSGEPGIAHCSRRSDIYLGSVDLRASLFTDHRHHVILVFACLIFAVGLDREIILTAKFSRSTVYTTSVRSFHFKCSCMKFFSALLVLLLTPLSLLLLLSFLLLLLLFCLYIISCSLPLSLSLLSPLFLLLFLL